MLSDHEQRALEELERWYGLDAPDPIRSKRSTKRSSRRSSRRPGWRTVSVLALVSLALLFADVPAAAFALGLATSLGWAFWRLWAHRTDDGSFPVPPRPGGGRGRDDSDRPPGDSLRRYLTWLAKDPE